VRRTQSISKFICDVYGDMASMRLNKDDLGAKCQLSRFKDIW